MELEKWKKDLYNLFTRTRSVSLGQDANFTLTQTSKRLFDLNDTENKLDVEKCRRLLPVGVMNTEDDLIRMVQYFVDAGIKKGSEYKNVYIYYNPNRFEGNVDFDKITNAQHKQYTKIENLNKTTKKLFSDKPDVLIGNIYSSKEIKQNLRFFYGLDTFYTFLNNRSKQIKFGDKTVEKVLFLKNSHVVVTGPSLIYKDSLSTRLGKLTYDQNMAAQTTVETWQNKSKLVYNVSEAGSGKTFMALGSIKKWNPDAAVFLFVYKAQLHEQWLRTAAALGVSIVQVSSLHSSDRSDEHEEDPKPTKIDATTSLQKTLVVSGRAKKERISNIHLLGDNKFIKDKDDPSPTFLTAAAYSSRPSVVVVDEAHVLNSTEANRALFSKELKYWATESDSSDKRRILFLSATPFDSADVETTFKKEKIRDFIFDEKTKKNLDLETKIESVEDQNDFAQTFLTAGIFVNIKRNPGSEKDWDFRPKFQQIQIADTSAKWTDKDIFTENNLEEKSVEKTQLLKKIAQLIPTAVYMVLKFLAHKFKVSDEYTFSDSTIQTSIVKVISESGDVNGIFDPKSEKTWPSVFIPLTRLNMVFLIYNILFIIKHKKELKPLVDEGKLYIYETIAMMLLIENYEDILKSKKTPDKDLQNFKKSDDEQEKKTLQLLEKPGQQMETLLSLKKIFRKKGSSFAWTHSQGVVNSEYEEHSQEFGEKISEIAKSVQSVVDAPESIVEMMQNVHLHAMTGRLKLSTYNSVRNAPRDEKLKAVTNLFQAPGNETHVLIATTQSVAEGQNFHSTVENRPKLGIMFPSFNVTSEVQLRGRLVRQNSKSGATYLQIKDKNGPLSTKYEELRKAFDVVQTVVDSKFRSSRGRADSTEPATKTKTRSRDRASSVDYKRTQSGRRVKRLQRKHTVQI